MISGSSLWSIEADPQNAAKPEIAENLETNTGQVRMAEERAEIAVLLQQESGDSILDNRSTYAPRPCITEVFASLQTLADADVTRILTYLMAESLSVASPLVDTVAQVIDTDMAQHWKPDTTFFDLIRDKQVLNAMVGRLAGTDVAKANVATTGKTQRAILCDCLNGTRVPADPNWMPPHLAFPSGSYRDSLVGEEYTAPSLQEAA
jgi:ParB family chromosome partitioning protein